LNIYTSLYFILFICKPIILLTVKRINIFLFVVVWRLLYTVCSNSVNRFDYIVILSFIIIFRLKKKIRWATLTNVSCDFLTEFIRHVVRSAGKFIEILLWRKRLLDLKTELYEICTQSDFTRVLNELYKHHIVHHIYLYTTDSLQQLRNHKYYIITTIYYISYLYTYCPYISNRLTR